MTTMTTREPVRTGQVNRNFDWRRVAGLVFQSRAMDEIEETELFPKKLVPYQFSARGHDLAQVLLASLLSHRHDAAGAYYRSRPFLLTLGLTPEDGFAASLARSGSFSDGRDIGAVCNMPTSGGCTVLPMAGDVGSQFTPCAGWAQAIDYRAKVLKDPAFEFAMSVALGGDGSVATNGFWSALTMATTLRLPMLFYIEDNGYALSVPSDKQTPGRNIARNLASFGNLAILDGNGCDPEEASGLIHEAVELVRAGKGPALLRLTIPRLCGHSGQDTQTYKSKETLEEEQSRDPIEHLHAYLVPAVMSDDEWTQTRQQAEKQVREALRAAIDRPEPDARRIHRHVFLETAGNGTPQFQIQGGMAPEGISLPAGSPAPTPEPTRSNMLSAIRRTLESELRVNPRLLVFGEDVGPKGGVHAATMGLQEMFGDQRVFDTSLSEEGIIGRAVGMAFCGLMPVTEIQFRKYADPATEQLNNCGTIRWRTNNRFAAPIVVRIPGGFSKCGDPWHSVSGEVTWLHGIGWQVCYPSNAEDAVGLLRAALRSHNPTIFFEHRNLLDNAWARRPYPGDDFVLPMGKAKCIQEGRQLTIVTWGAMVERCERAAKESGLSVEVLDLRTLSPWDREAVLASVRKTHRCLIVHEDNETVGFGSEVAAVVAKEAFFQLDAPIERVTTPDVPLSYNVGLMNAVIPSVEQIAAKIRDLIAI